MEALPVDRLAPLLVRSEQMAEDKGGGDLLGLRPFGDALHVATRVTVEGAAAFLGRICNPAADELGLFLRDGVRAWRAKNALGILAHAEDQIKRVAGETELKAPPRLVTQIIESGSWSDDPRIHTMWAGLLSSACTSDGRDEGNLMFIDVLSKMTSSEARVFAYACKKSGKRVSEAGWLHADLLAASLETLREISGVEDGQRLSRELDHLRQLGILDSGFGRSSTVADLTPTSLGLQMFARCEGCNTDPAAFLGARRSALPVDEPRPSRKPAKTRKTSRTVLVVDDEPTIANSLAMVLSRAGYKTEAAYSGELALEAVRRRHFDVAVLDFRMPDLRGDRVFEEMTAMNPGLRGRTIFITGDISPAAERALKLCNSSPILWKPFPNAALLDAVEKRLHSRD
jgi:CheY-like chemotaxis protein